MTKKKPVCRRQCHLLEAAPGTESVSKVRGTAQRPAPRLGTRQEQGLGWRNKPAWWFQPKPEIPRSTTLSWADNLGHPRL